MVRPVKSRRKDRLVSQEGRRGLDLTEIFGPVKSGPVKDWSEMGSLQASLSSLRLVADWLFGCNCRRGSRYGSNRRIRLDLSHRN